jgi:hypothetical protein
MAAIDHGWRLLRVAELLRTVERHQDRALRIVYQLDPRMPPTFGITLKRAAVELLRHEVAEIAQLVEQLDALGEGIPDEAIPVAYGDVRDSAEQVLRQSTSVDPATVLLAAQLLDRPAGLHALADGLRSSDAYTTWATTTVGSLLGAIRGVSPQLARRIATAARLAPGTEISGCHPDEVAQLAEQLDLHARG